MILTDRQRTRLREVTMRNYHAGDSTAVAYNKAKEELYPQFKKTNEERLDMIHSGDEEKEALMLARLTNEGRNHKSREYEDASVIKVAGMWCVYALRKGVTA
jgi:hypothetical protein